MISGGVRALASAPHLKPFGVYYVLALSMGKGTEIESEGAAPTHPLARAVAMHTFSFAPPACARPATSHPSLGCSVLPCPPRTPRSGPYSRPALLAHPLGSDARERLH